MGVFELEEEKAWFEVIGSLVLGKVARLCCHIR